jgi:cyclopropane-fatty-acyl-phospholipid synthase
VPPAPGPRPAAPGEEARLSGARHTRGRDRAAIAHRYDLGNDFYRLVLDPSMAYSSGYWTQDSPEYTVAHAQRDRLDLVCGWGSMIIHAAKHFGARTTGVTISRQQHAHVKKRVADEGLDALVTVKLQDYREVDDEPFDAISTIEMVALVGEGQARVWRLYLAGGALTFEEGRMGVDQVLALRPSANGTSGMPRVRDWVVR